MNLTKGSRMAIQGKCEKCKVRYTWGRDIPLLMFCSCPKCGTGLTATSKLSKLPAVSAHTDKIRR